MKKENWLLYVTMCVVRDKSDRFYPQWTNQEIVYKGTWEDMRKFSESKFKDNFLTECVTVVSNEPYVWVPQRTTRAHMGNAWVLYTTWEDTPANIEYVFATYSEAVQALESLNKGAYDTFVCGHICLETI